MFNRKTMLIFAVALAAMLVLAACGPAATPTLTPVPPTPTPTRVPPTPIPPTPTLQPAFPVTLTDFGGRTVKIDKAPQRIVSLAPSNTELAFALGLGSKIVGVDDVSDYPAEAKNIQKVGAFKLNFEQIIALQPDLVLVAGITSKDDLAKLEGFKLTVLVIAPNTLDEVYKGIELAGKASGASDKAAALVADMKKRVDAVKAKIATTTTQPVVFYEIDATDPAKPYTIGPGTLHHELIALAGGVNAAGSAKSPYPQLSLEELLKVNPDIILLGDSIFGTTVESALKRTGWATLKAVKNKAVFPFDDNLVSRPGSPRVVDGLEALAKAIHPEAFK